MSKLTNQWIELFRAGDHGPKGVFTNADLDQIVGNYQPGSGHEAPATIGHIKGAAPAYGWFQQLKRQGSVLLGKMHQVQPEFEEMVEKGLFKKRSVGLAKYDTGWGLHHVAFLGAQPPEIKGLADCKFEDSSAPVVEVEFQENQMADEATLIDKLIAKFEERFGKKPETASFTEAQVKEFATEAVTQAIVPLQAKLDAQAVSFAESQKKITTGETKGRALDAINKLKAAGRWVPAFDKSHLSLVFEELAKSTEVVEFGEGAEKKSVTPLDALVSFMEQLPKIVPTGEVYTGQAPTRVTNGSKVNGAADANSVQFDEAIQSYMTEHKVEYKAAALKVAALRPELTIPGGASAGAV